MAFKQDWMKPVWAIAGMIPPGRVMTYGSISALLPGVTARMVGAAMAACPEDEDIPWWRVINSQGKISPRPSGHQHLQRKLLEEEGLVFSAGGRVSLQRYLFRPPDTPA